MLVFSSLIYSQILPQLCDLSTIFNDLLYSCFFFKVFKQCSFVAISWCNVTEQPLDVTANGYKHGVTKKALGTAKARLGSFN